MSQLEDLLKKCTVKISIPNRTSWGTGFFIDPKLILTCAHVIREISEPTVQIQWQDQNLEASIESSSPEPYDLAILRITSLHDYIPPCVYLDDEVQSRDNLYLFGYPDDFPKGSPVTAQCEGLTGDSPPLIKFALGQVRPGISGSPLLNQRTGKVCGITKFTLNRSSNLGGGAIPVQTVFSCFPDLININKRFHKGNYAWKRFLPKQYASHLDRQDSKNREHILKQVEEEWIRGVLEHSLHNKVLTSLSIEEHPNAVSSTWDFEVETDSLERSYFPAGIPFSFLFDQIGVGETLLILGEPGSGKTISLLQLAKHFVELANQDTDQLIPVVLNLSSWTNDTRNDILSAKPEVSIKDWVIKEINERYWIPPGVARQWVDGQRLLLLLDGLDEVHPMCRNDCVLAINNFQKNQFTEIVVCSRSRDYNLLEHKLKFKRAIHLKYFSEAQIADYLDKLGREKVAGLKNLLKHDLALRELAKIPLMLNVMIIAYGGISSEVLLQRSTLQDRQSQLFDDYIDRVLEKRRTRAFTANITEDFRHKNPEEFRREKRFSKQITVNRLTWLAQNMSQGYEIIYYPENMTKSWLIGSFDNRIYAFLGNSFIFASSVLFIVYAVALEGLEDSVFFWISAAIALLTFLSFDYSQKYVRNCISLPVLSYVNGLMMWFSTAFLVGLALLLATEDSVVVRIEEVFRLFNRDTAEMVDMAKEINGAVKSLFEKDGKNIQHIIFFIGFLVYYIVSLVYILLERNFHELGSPKQYSGNTKIFLILNTKIFRKLAFPFFELEEPGNVQPEVEENEIKEKQFDLINQSFTNSVLSFVFIPLFSITAFLWFFAFFNGIPDFIMIYKIMILAFSIGLLFAIMAGGSSWFSYLVLRLILSIRGYLPLNHSDFLDYASERILLQKVGKGYKFMHRLLMEHFAKKSKDHHA